MKLIERKVWKKIEISKTDNKRLIIGISVICEEVLHHERFPQSLEKLHAKNRNSGIIDVEVITKSFL